MAEMLICKWIYLGHNQKNSIAAPKTLFSV